jgi:hypothetical protein
MRPQTCREVWAVRMHFAHVIQSRIGRAWTVLIVLAIMLILIGAYVLLFVRSPGPFDMDEIYGLLD